MAAEDRMNEEMRVTYALAKAILAGGEKFKVTSPMNAGYTPRSIEVPWAASHINPNSAILDVGLSLANLDYLGLLLDAIEQYGVALEAADIIKPEKVASRYPDEWRDATLQ